MMTTVLDGFVSRLIGLDQRNNYPNRPRDQASARNAQIVDGIICALMQNNWAKPLEENKPNREMEGDLPPPGRLVVGTKTDPPVDKKVNRQSHGNGEGIVEMTVKERGIMMQVRLDERAVDGVRREADEKNRIAPVTKIPVFIKRHRGSQNWPPS